MNIKKRFSTAVYKQQLSLLQQLTNSQLLHPYSYPRLLSAIIRQMALISKMQKFILLPAFSVFVSLWVRRENRIRETSFSLDNVNRSVTHLQVHHRTYRIERCFKLFGTGYYRQCTMGKIPRARASSSGIMDNSAISAQSDLRRKICTTH